MPLITNDQQSAQLPENDVPKDVQETVNVDVKEDCTLETPKEKKDPAESKDENIATPEEEDVQKTAGNECITEDKTTSAEQSTEKEHHEPAIQEPERNDNAKDGAVHETNATESLDVAKNSTAEDHMMYGKGEAEPVKAEEPFQESATEAVSEVPSEEHKISIVITPEKDEKSVNAQDSPTAAPEESKDDQSTATSTPVELSYAEEQSMQSADLASSFEVVEALPDNDATVEEKKDTVDSGAVSAVKDEKTNELSEHSRNADDSTQPPENETKTDASETDSSGESTKPVGEAEPPVTVVTLATEEDIKPVPKETMSTPVIRPLPSPTPPPRRPSSAVFAGNLSKNGSTASFGSGKLFNTLPRHPSPLLEEATRKKKKGMFSWLGGDSSKKKNKEVLESVSDGLRKIYKQKLYPLEEFYRFHDFHSPALDDPDFDAKPMILLVGQYSTGKTTFIRYLLEQDFPGIRIGPEPTTDRFIAVMHSEEEGVIPGNALVVDAKKQFRALSGFGNAFLNRFQCSTLPNQVLESITIVDTPGILSGEKQRIDRGYDFTGVLEWFAERVDRIILLFDAHKLDISDEFKRCIEALGGNEDKIRIVLNKSDMVDHQQLMRVYGALMWSLGKVFRTPEVSRVYLGSFWDKPLTYDINRRLFVDEQHDLFQDLQALPRNAALRKLNDLIKRARLAKVHAYIISELRKQMPSMIGKDKKKKELIQNLDKIFEQIQREHNISPGDFPDIQKMREKLQNQDFTKFNPLKPKLLEVVDGMLASDIARLMAQIPKEEQTANADSKEQPTVRGGAFAQAQEAETPFGFGRGEGFDKGADEQGWVVSRERSVADSTFDSLNPVNGFISGRAAKEHMVKSKLPNAVLGKIWKLADVDQDGQLDGDEFALANYLINLKLEGHELPAELPAHLIPPSKREKEAVYPNLDEE